MERRGDTKRDAFYVRHYMKRDLDACRGLWRQLAEKHAEIYSDGSIAGADVEDSFNEHLNKIGPKMIWVATVGSKVVGFVGLMTTPGSKEDGEIEPLIVHRDYRGRGIGRALVDVARKEAIRLGVKFVTVRPVARNKAALKFFRDEGFDKLGKIELFIDLSGKDWEKGIKLHGVDFEF